MSVKLEAIKLYVHNKLTSQLVWLIKSCKSSKLGRIASSRVVSRAIPSETCIPVENRFTLLACRVFAAYSLFLFPLILYSIFSDNGDVDDGDELYS